MAARRVKNRLNLWDTWEGVREGFLEEAASELRHKGLMGREEYFRHEEEYVKTQDRLGDL